MKKGRILVVDDHKQVLDSLVQILQIRFREVEGINSIEALPEKRRTWSPDILILDMNFSAGVNTGNEGLYWLKKIKEQDPYIQIIAMTAYGEIDLAVKAIKAGAFDFLQKPWENEALYTTVGNALELRQSLKKVDQLTTDQQQLVKNTNSSPYTYVYQSASMQKVMKQVDKVAATDAQVLLTGKNGTGKSMLAREIHLRSPRAGKPFVQVDLAALPESLIESELFGHVRGAFTGANDDYYGKMRLAEGGTLFLDEVGNIPLNIQVKLLQALQENRITALGSNTPFSLDFRLICATNATPETMIAEKTFRQDLYYRINTIQLEIPPLQARPEDIVPLANYYLNLYRQKYRKEMLEIKQADLHKLLKYSWPGNIRELAHVIEKAVILSEKNELQLDPGESPATILQFQGKSLDEIEKQAIANCLERHEGNIREAANELQVARQTLYNKIRKYNLLLR